MTRVKLPDNFCQEKYGRGQFLTFLKTLSFIRTAKQRGIEPWFSLKVLLLVLGIEVRSRQIISQEL